MTDNEKYLEKNQSYLVKEVDGIYELANAGLLHHLNGVRVSKYDNTKYVYFVNRTPETGNVLRAYWSKQEQNK